MFIAEGENDKILKLIGRIRGMRGIQQVKSIIITL
jgi:metal-responsive CopG/Arc/MetJ family transcriptional regulator